MSGEAKGISGDEWQSFPCPLCGAMDRDVILCGTVSLFGTPAEVRIARCACGFRLTDPQPRGAALDSFYSGADYYTHHQRLSAVKVWLAAFQLWGPLARLRLLSERAGLVLPHVSRFLIDTFPLRKGMRLLDFGCGSGVLVRAGMRRGLACFGVEPDAKARAADLPVAEDLAGVDVIAGAALFDRIVLSHVLEHLPDPVTTMRRLSARLLKGGLMRVSVPNADSQQAERFGLNWIGFDPPRHLWHFDFESLSRIATMAGLRQVAVATVELPQFANATIANMRRQGLAVAAERQGHIDGRGAELIGVFERVA